MGPAEWNGPLGVGSERRREERKTKERGPKGYRAQMAELYRNEKLGEGSLGWKEG